MRLENADVIADLLRQTQQVGGGVHVGRHAQVSPLDVDQTQQVGCEGREVGLFGPFAVRLEEGVVALGHRGHDDAEGGDGGDGGDGGGQVTGHAGAERGTVLITYRGSRSCGRAGGAEREGEIMNIACLAR